MFVLLCLYVREDLFLQLTCLHTVSFFQLPWITVDSYLLWLLSQALAEQIWPSAQAFHMLEEWWNSAVYSLYKRFGFWLGPLCVTILVFGFASASMTWLPVFLSCSKLRLNLTVASNQPMIRESFMTVLNLMKLMYWLNPTLAWHFEWFFRLAFSSGVFVWRFPAMTAESIEFKFILDCLRLTMDRKKLRDSFLGVMMLQMKTMWTCCTLQPLD